MTTPASPPATTTFPATPSVIAPPVNTVSMTFMPMVVSSTSKPVAQSFPILQIDATFQVFRQWRPHWQDFSSMFDLQRLSREKQLIQLRMSVLLDVQRILEHTLGIAPDTSLTVNEVLDELQSHFKGQHNEAFRRRELLRCRQTHGEPFSDFYVQLKDLAEEVDLCSGNPVTCAEIQLKMVLLMGVREEELVRRLISLDTGASLQDVVTCCRSFEATQTAASAIHSSPSQLCALSSYKKGKCRDKITHSSQQVSSAHCEKTSDGNSTSSAYPCPFCAHQHGSGKCSTADGTCFNCGGKGHWAKTDKCPAKKAICRLCKKNTQARLCSPGICQEYFTTPDVTRYRRKRHCHWQETP